MSGHVQSGFTMIEILITVLVLSIGLLGLAALQVTGLKESQMAYMRSQAVLLAYDMADRIRANPAAARDGDYSGAPVSSTQDCESVDCDTSQMASYDRNAWLNALAFLPTGTGHVDDGGTPGDGEYTVSVCWDQGRTGVAIATCDPDVALDDAVSVYRLDVAL